MTKSADMIQKIIDYLDSRPDGEDTLEGITKWWIRMDKGTYAVDELKATLNILLEKGELDERKVWNDLVTYRTTKRQKV